MTTSFSYNQKIPASRSQTVTLYYDLVTLLDFAWINTQGQLIGDSLEVDVELTSPLNTEGMVLDFSLAKKLVKAWIDSEVDHRVIIALSLSQNQDNQGKNQKQKSELNWEILKENNHEMGIYSYKKLHYSAPLEAFVCLPGGEHWGEHLLHEQLIHWMNRQLSAHLTKQVGREIDAKLVLRRSAFSQRIKFHYTHGLKQHLGNCQRLWHGHESVFEICKCLNEGAWERCIDLERIIYEDLFQHHPHFVLQENVKNLPELSAHWSLETDVGIPFGLSKPKDSKHIDETVVHIEYQSSQGTFKCTLPRQQVVILPTETTVELLSSRVALWAKNHLQLVYPQQNYRVMVKLSEGISKGAITFI